MRIARGLAIEDCHRCHKVAAGKIKHTDTSRTLAGTAQLEHAKGTLKSCPTITAIANGKLAPEKRFLRRISPNSDR